jgi:hypothetical protein
MWKLLLSEGYSFPEISTRLYGDCDSPADFMAAWRAYERRLRSAQ